MVMPTRAISFFIFGVLISITTYIEKVILCQGIFSSRKVLKGLPFNCSLYFYLKYGKFLLTNYPKFCKVYPLLILTVLDIA